MTFRHLAATLAGALALAAIPAIPVHAAASQPSSTHHAQAAVLTPPAAPFLTSAPAPQRVTFAWNSVSGAQAYIVFRNGAQIATTGGTSWQDNSVSPSAGYRYTLRAIYQTGTSAEGPGLNITTPALRLAPPNVSVSQTGPSQLTFANYSWNGAAYIQVAVQGRTVWLTPAQPVATVRSLTPGSFWATAVAYASNGQTSAPAYLYVTVRR